MTLEHPADGTDRQKTYRIHNIAVPARPLEPALYLVATPIGNLADIKRCARWKRWPAPMCSPARIPVSPASCSTATASSTALTPIMNTMPTKPARA